VKAVAERRGASRIEVNLAVRYCSARITLSGKVANLSRRGLFLVSDYTDGHGQMASLLIELADADEPLAVTGRVVRTAGAPSAGMAIEFHRLTGAAKKKLANFMIGRRAGV
jgi:hypothetical protein